MRRPSLAMGGALLALSVSTSALPRAQAVAGEPQRKATIDPGALTAVQQMGAFLRSLQSMEVEAEVTTDDVLPTGQKVQYSATVNLKAQRPDRLRVEIAGDRRSAWLFYDGTTFTSYDPKLGYYASFTAPPTIAALVDVLEHRYGVDLPLADLFRLGTDRAQLAAIRSAKIVGPSTVKGTPCIHYAFHQNDIDWEIWLEDGVQPLPRKLVVTTLTERSEPQHVSVMSWNLTPAFAAKTFAFMPPPSAHRVDFDVDRRAP